MDMSTVQESREHMLLSLSSHLLGAWFAFALPCYKTFKALTHNPDQLTDLAKYWAVLALFIAFEHTLGLVLSWLPFYWELRTIFLLYISLPQTQGSTYVYTSLLHPLLSKNEAEIDAAIVSAQSNALAFCRARIVALFDLISNAAQIRPSADGDKATRPLSVPVDHLKALWAAYAPTVLAAVGANGSSDAHVSNTAKDVPLQS